MKIFILEDNQDRMDFFLDLYRKEKIVCTAFVNSAKLWLEDYEYDVLFLDHDLNEHNLEAITQKETGYDFVKYMVEKGLQKQAVIYVHSMNPAGAQSMVNLLQSNGYQAMWLPFHLLKQSAR